MQDSQDHFDKAILPFVWMNEGRSPISILLGYCELYIERGFGNIKDESISMVKEIDRRSHAILEGWRLLGDFFQISSNNSLTVDDFSQSDLNHLKTNIILPAIQDLVAIEKLIDNLLTSTIKVASQDQDAMSAMRQCCRTALISWQSPLKYIENEMCA